MRLIILFTLAINISIGSYAAKGETHFGKVKSAMGEYAGDIEIKLNEPNKDMITITLYEKVEKSPGKYQKTSQKIKLNTMIIHSIEIDSVVYLIKQLQYADGKTQPFCCIRLLEGKPEFGLYQWGADIDPKRQVVYFKNLSSYTLLSSPTLTQTRTSMMFLFAKCDIIKAELRDAKNGFITNDMDEAARSKEISRLIAATATCL
ncbi:hypothetical protein [Limnovirga soli]|uniref:Uncharacterized protein n=1 Tax=Limnovirga soli TaxID=2656915 RepID=A0A8J8JSS4_9BACT|nr:hypothetical protein [Limnovirga soli]NNV54395.1 hypothetical protein [Limnovirga soli]